MLMYELNEEKVKELKKNGEGNYEEFPLFNPYEHRFYDFSNKQCSFLPISTPKGVIHVTAVNNTFIVELTNSEFKKTELHVLNKGKGEIATKDIVKFYFNTDEEAIKNDIKFLNKKFLEKENLNYELVQEFGLAQMSEENVTFSFKYGENKTATISIMDSPYTYNIIADIAFNENKELYSGENDSVSAISTTIEDITMYSLDFM